MFINILLDFKTSLEWFLTSGPGENFSVVQTQHSNLCVGLKGRQKILDLSRNELILASHLTSFMAALAEN